MANTLTLCESASRRAVLSRGPSLQPERPCRPRVPLALRLRFARLGWQDCREIWPPIALWLDYDAIPNPPAPAIVIAASDRTLRTAERVSYPLQLFMPNARAVPRLGGVFERAGQSFAFVGSAAADCRASVRLMPLVEVGDARAAGFLRAESERKRAKVALDLDRLPGHRGHGQRVECAVDGAQYFLCGPRVELVAIYDVDGYRSLREREAASWAKFAQLQRERERNREGERL